MLRGDCRRGTVDPARQHEPVGHEDLRGAGCGGGFAGTARGVRRAHARAGRRRRRHRSRLPGHRCAHALGAGAGHRIGPCSIGCRLMLLAIDIGNTNTVLGVFEGDKMVHSWRVKTDSRNTADELMLTYKGLLEDVPITGIAGASTVPAALRELRAMLSRYWPDVPTVLVEPGVKTGVALLFDNPKEVGADRIVNTLAAFHLVNGPAIVVDFGTST